MFSDVLVKRLQKNREQGLWRNLSVDKRETDFSSNDYLGHARSLELHKKIVDNIRKYPVGSTGSRLLTGNSDLALDLERYLADFFNSKEALLFNSGLDLNIGLLSCLGREDDVLIMDELAHASLKAGAKLSKSKRLFFRHNDIEHLEKRLESNAGKNIFVVVESVYSMDGDLAPLAELVDICEKYSAELIVDEAHSAGVLGPMGKGLVCQLGLEEKVLARIHTFGKAFGVHGAVCLGKKELRDYLINFCHTFIYTTAAAPHSLVAIWQSLEFLKQNPKNLEKLQNNIQLFNDELGFKDHRSSIYSFVVGDGQKAKKYSSDLGGLGMAINSILSPTVQQGTERLRVCLHAYNTEYEIKTLAQFLRERL